MLDYSITKQGVTPVSYVDAAAHVRLDSNDDADYVEGLVAVAREYVDSLTNRQSTATEWRLTADSWEALFDSRSEPDDTRFHLDPRRGVAHQIHDGYVFPIKRVPLVSIDSIQYVASGDDTFTTLAAADYRVVTATEPGLVQLKSAPPSLAVRPDAIDIRFTAGAATTEVQKHAIKLMVAHLYENRAPINVGNIVSEIPESMRQLIVNSKTGGWF